MAAVGEHHSHVAAEVKMRRTLHAGSFVVLEGSDDLRFWVRRCHHDCRLIDGNGKQNVLVGLRRLDEIGFEGALGVVDSNHDYLAGIPLGSNNVGCHGRARLGMHVVQVVGVGLRLGRVRRSGKDWQVRTCARGGSTHCLA